MQVRVVAVNLGSAQPIAAKSGRSGIFKRPVEGPVAVGPEGLGGDTIVDRANHGGPDQAVYAYTLADYAWWTAQLDRELPPGSFGENLTLDGCESADFAIGDVLAVGALELEVTAPRIPCETLAARIGRPGFVRTFLEGARPGPYFRVKVPGHIDGRDARGASPVRRAARADRRVDATGATAPSVAGGAGAAAGDAARTRGFARCSAADAAPPVVSARGPPQHLHNARPKPRLCPNVRSILGPREQRMRERTGQMDRLTEMEAFATVVDQGGFTDAARKMGISKSAVSKHVSSLEARLGARLLNRTTRRVIADRDRAGLLRPGASRAERRGRGRCAGYLDAVGAVGAAADLRRDRFRREPPVAGAGRVPAGVPRHHRQHGAEQPLRGADLRRLRHGGPDRRAGGFHAARPQADRDHQADDRRAGLFPEIRPAAADRRPERAQAPALFEPVERRGLEGHRPVGRKAAGPHRRLAHRQRRAVAAERLHLRASASPTCRRSSTPMRWRRGWWKRRSPACRSRCRASMPSIRRAASPSRRCAPSSTSSSNAFAEKGPDAW